MIRSLIRRLIIHRLHRQLDALEQRIIDARTNIGGRR